MNNCPLYFCFIYAFRYKLNDTDLLDVCSFLDPRTKTLTHLPVEKQVQTKLEVESLLVTQVQPSDISAQEEDVMPKPKEPGILSSLLGAFQRESTSVSMPSAIMVEIESYVNMPVPNMESNPLLW